MGLHVGRIGIGAVGVLTVLLAAWGGIVPYIGPVFGYSADGAGSWHWNLTHAVLALVPGAIGVVAGVFMLRETRGVRVGRGRVSLTMTGLVVLLCGAWFVIGPLAWPVISDHGGYFVVASPLRYLANQVGYALGTGVLLAACGGFAIGWAARHQAKAVPTEAEVEAAAGPEVSPQGSPAGA